MVGIAVIVIRRRLIIGEEGFNLRSTSPINDKSVDKAAQMTKIETPNPEEGSNLRSTSPINVKSVDKAAMKTMIVIARQEEDVSHKNTSQIKEKDNKNHKNTEVGIQTTIRKTPTPGMIATDVNITTKNPPTNQHHD